MKLKRVCVSTMLLVIVLAVFTVCTPDSQAYSYIGKCGESVTYFHLADGTLYISGSGEIYDYSESNPAPWHEVADSITGLNISSGVSSIGSYAFSDCVNLRYISDGSGITSIGSYGFYNCSSLTSIPSGVTSIGSHAFASCSGITSMPSYVTTIGSYAFRDCTGLLSASFKGDSLSVGAFYGCTSLKTVSLYENLAVIPEVAFYNCSSLTSISFPDSLTTIEASAFEGCSAIESFNLPAAVAAIGVNCFKDCSSLTSFTIPESLTVLEEGIFSGCTDIGSVAMHNNMMAIGKEAFKDCEALLGIVLPDGLNELGEGAFSGCARLSSISLADGINSIADCAFKDCTAITYMEIPKDVKSIGREAFSGCASLAAISINEGLTDIGDHAFENCVSLTGCVLPSSISSIGEGIFKGCTSVKSVKFMGYLTRWSNVTVGSDNKLLSVENIITQYIDGGSIDNGIYWSVSNDGCLYLSGDGKMNDFEPNSAPWNSYAEIITDINVDKNITAAGAYSFSGLINIKEIQLPEGLTELAEGMFFGCSSLKTVIGLENINYIGESAFESCVSLLFDNAFDITLGKRAFAGCVSLEKLSISGSEIGEEAFTDCKGLKSVIIKKTVTEIGKRAFHNCPLELASYTGTKEELKAMTIDSDNNELTDVIGIHYFIHNIYIGSGTGRGEAEELIADKADEIISLDMNGLESKYVCLGYSLTSDPDEALTGVVLYSANGDNTDGSVEFNGVTYYLISTPAFTDKQGNSTYICTTRDVAAGEPIFRVGLYNNGNGKRTFKADDAWLPAEEVNGRISTFDGTAEGIGLFYTKDINADIKTPMSVTVVVVLIAIVVAVGIGAGVYFMLYKKGKTGKFNIHITKAGNTVFSRLNALRFKMKSKQTVAENVKGPSVKADKMTQEINKKKILSKQKREKEASYSERIREDNKKQTEKKHNNKPANLKHQKAEKKNKKQKTGFSMK